MKLKNSKGIELSEHWVNILIKMHELVGADIKEWKDEPNWFMKHEATKEQQEEFKEWFINYFRENKDARYKMMAFPSKVRKNVEKFWDVWWFQHFWKQKKEDSH